MKVYSIQKMVMLMFLITVPSHCHSVKQFSKSGLRNVQFEMKDGIPVSSELIENLGPDAQEAFEMLQKDAGDDDSQRSLLSLYSMVSKSLKSIAKQAPDLDDKEKQYYYDEKALAKKKQREKEAAE